MSRKETVVVAVFCSMTTILKICSIVAIYSHKIHDTYNKHTSLTHATITNDLLCAEECIDIKNQDDLDFQQTVVACR